jgi:hypothetical protein
LLIKKILLVQETVITRKRLCEERRNLTSRKKKMTYQYGASISLVPRQDSYIQNGTLPNDLLIAYRAKGLLITLRNFPLLLTWASCLAFGIVAIGGVLNWWTINFSSLKVAFFLVPALLVFGAIIEIWRMLDKKMYMWKHTLQTFASVWGAHAVILIYSIVYSIYLWNYDSAKDLPVNYASDQNQVILGDQLKQIWARNVLVLPIFLFTFTHVYIYAAVHNANGASTMRQRSWDINKEQ